VVGINGVNNDVDYHFIALANLGMPRPTQPGPVTRKNAAGGVQYIKGWLLSGMPFVLRFVYPKVRLPPSRRATKKMFPRSTQLRRAVLLRSLVYRALILKL
jgi:hypothetical protein